MLHEWTDKLPNQQVEAIWREQNRNETLQRIATIESDLQAQIAGGANTPAGFYDAMRHFIALRATLFPTLPVDPAWNILVTLASTPGGSAKASVTSIAYGAGVPLTTALRYIAALEIEGIVERTPDPGDRRRSIITLTAEGRHRLDTIAERWKSRALVIVTLLPLALAGALKLAGLA